MQAYRNLHARQRLRATHLILTGRHPERLDLMNGVRLSSGDRYVPFIRAQDNSREGIANGLYIPPVSAADPLPVKPHMTPPRGSKTNFGPWPTGDPTNPPRSKLTGRSQSDRP